ncbi:MAG: hypothetical protein EOO65_00980 [Methanosarcinales archaeon]|nr:MAG: hypothetical protein EOO65_00980 [Methanosarcinales archaeon]
MPLRVSMLPPVPDTETSNTAVSSMGTAPPLDSARSGGRRTSVSGASIPLDVLSSPSYDMCITELAKCQLKYSALCRLPVARASGNERVAAALSTVGRLLEAASSVCNARESVDVCFSAVQYANAGVQELEELLGREEASMAAKAAADEVSVLIICWFTRARMRHMHLIACLDLIILCRSRRRLRSKTRCRSMHACVHRWSNTAYMMHP